ncbi:thiamine-phosphate synthase family protein [Sulfolobus acidocaldarius]|nr:hypothetical protein SacN8_02145 [Sulfolobus acidocaldarius N8]AGE72684.1 hypothetical protein SacRon12I_02140 [Sulfolobus acidocaldarius Ron12/I]ALU30561.1 transcriptional regulator [Sulfolobus acidocaldarius]ALU32824.1 transcriptional regulator [Sulfolobus acidocaldarius]WCM35992.1 transcriptional regulator [Sulfolobus acidocaldarius DSM 639]
MTQSRIATLLGVSQPAIKQYLDEDEQEEVNKIRKMGLNEEEIYDVVNNVVELLLRNNTKSAMYYITDFGLRVLNELKLCKYHREINNLIPQDCDICKLFYHSSDEEIMDIAISLIQNPIVAPLIPQVLSNIAYAEQNAKNEDDVIAIPGRITRVLGVPTPASKPMRGASKHLSRILLGIIKKRGDIRAVMNIKYDETLKTVFSQLKLKVVYVGPHDYATNEDIAKEIVDAFTDDADCVVHLGGKNIEANTYVFGRDPIDVTKKVLNIARKYRELTENE